MRLTFRPLRVLHARFLSVLPTLAALASLPHVATGCASLPLVATAVPASKNDSTPARRTPPRCQGYVLLVENTLSHPVEIYEVGLMTDRFVAVALIGITEVPISDHTQQFVAISRGQLMAASASNERRPGDRVALQRGCREAI